MEPWEREWSDYYEELGVSPRATTGVIGAAYRTMAKEFHPDVATAQAERMHRVNAAHEVLSDPRRRSRYDIAYQSRISQASLQATTIQSPERTSDSPSSRSSVQVYTSQVPENRRQGERTSVGEWKPSAKHAGVMHSRIETNYYALGRWVNNTIVEVDRLDRRHRGSKGSAGNTYRSEQTGREALWDDHLKRVQGLGLAVISRMIEVTR